MLLKVWLVKASPGSLRNRDQAYPAPTNQTTQGRPRNLSAEVSKGSQSSLKFAQLPGLVTRFLIEVGEWMALLVTGKWSGRDWKRGKADEFLPTCVEFEEPAGASQLSKDILER